MSRDKQIEEMAKDLCDIDCKGMKCDVCDSYGCEYRIQAEALYNAGYRKSTDVAEEIFAEIEEHIITKLPILGSDIVAHLAELKKKYIGKDTNVTTKESEKDNG